MVSDFDYKPVPPKRRFTLYMTDTDKDAEIARLSKDCAAEGRLDVLLNGNDPNVSVPHDPMERRRERAERAAAEIARLKARVEEMELAHSAASLPKVEESRCQNCGSLVGCWRGVSEEDIERMARAMGDNHSSACQTSEFAPGDGPCNCGALHRARLAAKALMEGE